jgi:hypothetical protein
MRKLRISLTVGLLLMTGFAAPAMAADQDVTGTWNGTVRLRQGNRLAEDQFTLVMKQDGQKVTGTWGLTTGGTGSRGGRTSENVPARGTIEGDKLSLKIGQQRSLEATINGDSMSGTTEFGNSAPGGLTGTRAK